MFDAFTDAKTWQRLGLLSLLIGGIILYLAVSLMIEQSSASKWPTTLGRVNDVDIVRVSEKEYFPRASYSYGVKGRSYTGNSIWLGEPTTYPTLKLAAAALPGATNLATVRYDPSAPERSTLRTDGRTGLLNTAKGRWGLLFAAGAIACFVIGSALNRSQESWHVA